MSNLATNANASPVVGANSFLNMTESGLVSGTPGNLLGVFCASSTNGTLKLWNNTAASGAVLINTYELQLGWNPIPIRFSVALYATIGNTADITVSWS